MSPMQNLIIGMWSESRLSARHALDLLPPCANRRHRGPTATYRYRSIQKNVQDGWVWLMIGKLQLKRQDKVSFAAEADPKEATRLLQAEDGGSYWTSAIFGADDGICALVVEGLFDGNTGSGNRKAASGGTP
jgi:hypothetical protein